MIFFDFVQREADLLQLEDHVERRTLLEGVIAVPRFRIDLFRHEQAVLLIDHQRFFRYVVILGHLPDGEQIRHARPSARKRIR